MRRVHALSSVRSSIFLVGLKEPGARVVHPEHLDVRSVNGGELVLLDR
jgi:hypothetical protein